MKRASALCRVVLGGALASLGACGGNAPSTGMPGSVGPSPIVGAGVCQASLYRGATGGERIQGAVNDVACRTITIDAVGPDPPGVWLVNKAIALRSNLVLESAGTAMATLAASGDFAGGGLLTMNGKSQIIVRRLELQNRQAAPNGIHIVASRDITITQSAVTGARFNGVIVTGAPSTDIVVSQTTFESNGNVDVRTDTSGASGAHSRVIVASNVMRATNYGAAVADCGNSVETACEVRDNVISDVAMSGADLNRGHYGTVSGNQISGCGSGISIDDTDYATIARNTITGCGEYGIVLANGAESARSPWSVSHNRVTSNSVMNNGWYGLASFVGSLSVDDRNEANLWLGNRVEGNRLGGCAANVTTNTFAENGPQECLPQRGVTFTLAEMASWCDLPPMRWITTRGLTSAAPGCLSGGRLGSGAR